MRMEESQVSSWAVQSIGQRSHLGFIVLKLEGGAGFHKYSDALFYGGQFDVPVSGRSPCHDLFELHIHLKKVSARGSLVDRSVSMKWEKKKSVEEVAHPCRSAVRMIDMPRLMRLHQKTHLVMFCLPTLTMILKR